MLFCAGMIYESMGQSIQDSTTHTFKLKGVIIRQDRLQSAEVGLLRIQADSLMLEQFSGGSVTELLRISAAGQIRSYGSNGLTTPAFRGTGGSHTAVVWNGINLQSPTSGQQDFSLLPITFVDDLSILKGGSATLYGSGAIGGTIHLNNPVRFMQGLTIGTVQELGSFGNHFQGYKANWAGKKFQNSTRFFKRTIANDYPYINPYTRTPREENRINAAAAQYGLMQNNHLRLGKHQMLGIQLWWQENEVEIPEIVLAANDGEAIQEDDFFRGLLSWSYDKGQLGMSFKQAFLWHELFYAPTPSSTGSATDFISSQQIMEVQYAFSSRWEMLFGGTYKYEKADGSALRTPERYSITLLNSLKYGSQNERLKIAFNLREELVDAEFVPFTTSIGLNYQTYTFMGLRANLSRNYRIPTFNDLYWQSEGFSGNTDLKPEHSWNGEMGADFRLLNTQTKYATLGITVFSNTVSNWIAWQPDLSNEWSPTNIKTVWARGLDLSANGSIHGGGIDFSAEIQYSFVQSTNQQTDNGFVDGRQLIYTPRHLFSSMLSAKFKNYTLMANVSYTGSQHTDEQYLSFRMLPAYRVYNLALSRALRIGDFRGGFRLEINNIFNEQYENRRGYPMYGRNFTLGLNLNFNKIYDE